jgi:hypothetical protein
MTPSQTINALKGSIDIAVLLNHGKTLETGIHFGRIVASKITSSIPFVHIERPDSNGRIIYYDRQAKRCAEHIRNVLMKHGDYDLPIENSSPLPPQVENEGDRIIRRISGALPGENIRLDGIIIGHAASEQPEIVCRDGRVVELRGGIIKPHGLEKLENRRIDLAAARVKTGNIRRSHRIPRKKTAKHQDEMVALIDHCAESTFELVKDAGLVVTVGDDTTAIAADILVRLGIPIIGITDGDLDCILDDSAVPAGSVIIRVKEGFDDMVGREVSEKVMCGSQSIRMNVDDLLIGILALVKKYLVDVKYY